MEKNKGIAVILLYKKVINFMDLIKNQLTFERDFELWDGDINRIFGRIGTSHVIPNSSKIEFLSFGSALMSKKVNKFTRLKEFTQKDIDFVRSIKDERDTTKIDEVCQNLRVAQTKEYQSYKQKNNYKMIKLLLIERYWKTQGLIDSSSGLSLLDHAQKEWNILIGLLTGQIERIPFQNFGIPSTNQASALKALFAKYFTQEISLINESALLLLQGFFSYFLILHDIGKIYDGDNGHEKRSEERIKLLFQYNKNIFDRLKDKEWKLLWLAIGEHSTLDRVRNDDPNIAQDAQERIIKIFTNAELHLSQEEQRILFLGLVIFRIAEGVQSEHFGIIDENTIKSKFEDYKLIKTKLGLN
ncbi:MAG TPA: hypothetical protein DCS13_02940 [Candidatus Margulisbacteria bacterium]|nr:hypothetical protein [Candidatus Margulisiibacteriota bacterium]